MRKYVARFGDVLVVLVALILAVCAGVGITVLLGSFLKSIAG